MTEYTCIIILQVLKQKRRQIEQIPGWAWGRNQWLRDVTEAIEAVEKIKEGLA